MFLMTVKLLIDELLEKHGKTAYWLAVETGIAHSVMHKLRYGKLESIRLDYIDRICQALECQPGDLIVRMTDGKKTGSRKGQTTRA
jgi:putative transcriptional regulator